MHFSNSIMHGIIETVSIGGISMKTSEKAIVIGIISFVSFTFVNLFLGSTLGIVIPGGDDFMNSYFFPIYAGINTLIALVISCTYLIVKKINFLVEEINKNK